MRKATWMAGALVALGLAGAGLALAQTQDPAPISHMMSQGGQGGMMRGGMTGQGGMMGQPTQEQLDQFATLHGLTVEQAKQMTDLCRKVTSQANQNPQL